MNFKVMWCIFRVGVIIFIWKLLLGLVFFCVVYFLGSIDKCREVWEGSRFRVGIIY